MDPKNETFSKGRLSRELICETALDLIDQVGLEALSMRMLAGVLGVKASSLYYHFGSKDELLAGVAESLYRRLGRPPGGDEWGEQVKATFVQLRDFVQLHPNAAPLLVRDLAYSPIAKKRANVLLRLVRKAGVDPVASASLLSNLVALLVGHTLLSLWFEEKVGPAGAGEEAGEETRDQTVAAPRAWVRKLFPEERFDSPDVPDLAGALPADPVFLAGLDALIGGFAQDAR